MKSCTRSQVVSGTRHQVVSGQPIILNFGTPTEKCSGFLDYHLKPLLQKIWSYTEDSGDFTKKTRNLDSISRMLF